GELREGCDEVAVLAPGCEAVDGGVVELSEVVQLKNSGLRLRIVDPLGRLRANTGLDAFDHRPDCLAQLGCGDPEKPRSNRPWKDGQQFAKRLRLHIGAADQ